MRAAAASNDDAICARSLLRMTPERPDRSELLGVDLGSYADHQDVEVVRLELLVELVVRDPLRAIRAVGEDHERAERQRRRRRRHLAVQDLERLDDRAVEVGRRIVRLERRQVRDPRGRRARRREAGDLVDLLAAVERVRGDLLVVLDAIGERLVRLPAR